MSSLDNAIFFGSESITQPCKLFRSTRLVKTAIITQNRTHYFGLSGFVDCCKTLMLILILICLPFLLLKLILH